MQWCSGCGQWWRGEDTAVHHHHPQHLGPGVLQVPGHQQHCQWRHQVSDHLVGYHNWKAAETGWICWLWSAHEQLMATLAPQGQWLNLEQQNKGV